MCLKHHSLIPWGSNDKGQPADKKPTKTKFVYILKNIRKTLEGYAADWNIKKGLLNLTIKGIESGYAGIKDLIRGRLTLTSTSMKVGNIVERESRK